MIAPDPFRSYIMTMEWRGAEKSSEARSRYVGIALVMDVSLVVVEELILLLRKGIWFEGDFKPMVMLDARLHMGLFALVYHSEQIEGAGNALLFFFALRILPRQLMDVLVSKYVPVPTVESLSLIACWFELIGWQSDGVVWTTTTARIR